MENIKLDKTGCIKNVTEWWWILNGCYQAQGGWVVVVRVPPFPLSWSAASIAQLKSSSSSSDSHVLSENGFTFFFYRGNLWEYQCATGPQSPISFGPLKFFDSNHNIKINKLYSLNNINTQLIVFAWELAIFCHHNNNHHHVWISQLGIEAISSHDLMTIRWRWSSARWWLRSSL